MNKKQSIAMLFATWPRKDNEQPLDVLVRPYDVATMYCAPWAVERAVTRFIQGNGKGHNAAFRPSAAQIADVATDIQNDEQRASETANRIEQQSRRIEFQGAPEHQKAEQSKVWNRIKTELSKQNIAELADAYIANGLSVSGAVFTLDGARFPDGTFHSIEQMRKTLNSEAVT